jgi:hypothetical protein
MPLGHVSLPCGPSNYGEMREFYITTLATLGYRKFLEHDKAVIGFGRKHEGPDFWIHCGQKEFEKFDGTDKGKQGKTHVAFMAKTKADVDRWYASAM